MTWAIATTIIWCWCAFRCAICISSHQLKKKTQQTTSSSGQSFLAYVGSLHIPADRHKHKRTQLADEQTWRSSKHRPIKQSIKVIRFNSASLNVYNWQQQVSNQANGHTFLLIMQISISLQLPVYLPLFPPPTDHASSNEAVMSRQWQIKLFSKSTTGQKIYCSLDKVDKVNQLAASCSSLLEVFWDILYFGGALFHCATN